MAKQNQISSINGIINRDYDFKIIATDKGQVFSRTNLRVNSIDGGKMANFKIKGNKNIPLILPEGNNKCVGWCHNLQVDALVYFLYNDTGNHSILRFYQKTKIIEKIWFEQSDLGLIDKVVRAKVVEDMLYWVQEGVALKSFMITKAVNYTNNLSGNAYNSNYAPFQNNIFPLIKRSPQFAPITEYGTINNVDGIDINFNNLRKSLWQFKYNYVYDEDQESTYSATSKIPLPQSEITITGLWVDDICTNNGIYITVNTGSHAVKRINIAVKNTSDNNGGSFSIFETIKKFDIDGNQLIDDNITYQKLFLNNVPLKNIDTEINNRYFDDVPLTCNDIALMDGKWLGVSMPTKGYNFDESQLDYSLEIIEKNVSLGANITQMNVVYSTDPVNLLWNTGGCPDFISNVRSVFDITIPATFISGGIYEIAVREPVEGTTGFFTARVVVGDTESATYPTDVRDDLLNQLLAADRCDYPETTKITVIAVDTDKIQLIVHNILLHLAPDVFLKAFVAEYLEYISAKSLKRGQYHPFGIIYNDGFGRYNIVFGDKELYSPLIESPNFNTIISPKITINSRPPIYAATYRIVYLPHKSYTYELFVQAVEQVKGDGGLETGISSGKYFLRINDAIQSLRDEFPDSKIESYIWQDGDRVRRFGYEKSFELSEYSRTYEVNGETFIEVGFVIDDDIGGIFPTANPNIKKVDNIEIYRPNKNLIDNIYYEIGEEFDILDNGTASRRHSGNIINQTADLLTPAVSELDFGDVYYRNRIVGDINVYIVFVEDMAYADYYISNAIDIGRVGARIKSEQVRLHQVVRSENYIKGTDINWLNVFLAQAKNLDVSEIFGEITGVEVIGNLMKVIQEHKETSVYFGKMTQRESDGLEYILRDDHVFGSYRKYEETRGTTYRRSLITNLRFLYYFDESTGEFIRSAPNGQVAISKEYLMQSYFEHKAKALREFYGHKDVIVAVNRDYNEVSISFIIGTEIETVVFSEDDDNKGWLYFAKYEAESSTPENFAFLGDNFYSFLNGQFWLHEQLETERNTFYNKVHECSISFVLNRFPSIKKRLSSIEISTDKNIWDVKIITSASTNYTQAQKTILQPSIIREMEGTLVSDILRNIIRQNGTEDIQLLHNGQRIIGETFLTTLSNNDNVKVILNEVDIKFLISK